jgi:hypothetical protein
MEAPPAAGGEQRRRQLERGGGGGGGGAPVIFSFSGTLLRDNEHKMGQPGDGPAGG